MLVIRVELWPGGCESAKRVLCEGTIVNDGSGTQTLGNYRVKLGRSPHIEGKIWKRGRVEGFNRKKRGCWDLLQLSLNACLGKRNRRIEDE